MYVTKGHTSPASNGAGARTSGRGERESRGEDMAGKWDKRGYGVFEVEGTDLDSERLIDGRR
jgi:hypothetical protein